MPRAFPSLAIFIATQREAVLADCSRYLSVDGSVRGFATRWDHHVTGETINLDATADALGLRVEPDTRSALSDAGVPRATCQTRPRARVTADMSKDAISVAVDVYKGIAVHAKGTPANIVAVSAAAAIAALGAGLGYGAYRAAQSLTQGGER